MAYPISDVPRRIVYSGSVGVGPYAFTFEVLTASDIAVYKNATLLTLTTDYTVSINTGTGTGTVTLVVAATGADTVTLVGDRAIQRTSDFVTGGDLFANTLNAELDAQTIYAQQIDEKSERAIRAPVTDPTTINMVLPPQATRASKALGFNASGNPTQSSSTLAAIDAAVTTIQTLAAASPGSSAGISHIAAGSGAVATTVQAKLRETVSVLDFGADPTGGTDSATAFTNAIATGKLVLAPKGTYLRGVTSTTYATDQFIGVLRVGEKTTTNSSDPQVIVAREVDASGSGNGHCFSDSSNINRAGTISYNSYDARVTWSGSNTYGHYAAFQSGAVYDCSGTTTDWFHFFAGLEVTDGTITNNKGLTFSPPTLSGSGYVRQNFAVYVNNLPEYTGTPATNTTNYALYSSGAARVWANGQATFKNVFVSDAEGTPGARVHINETSGTATRLRIQQQGFNYFDFVIPASQTYMQISQAAGAAAVATFMAGASGVMGLGTTVPNVSDIGGGVLQQDKNTVASGTGADLYVSSNAYYNGGWKYTATATASQIVLVGNSMRFNVASSGSAGTAINSTGIFTEGGRWDSNAYLLIGYTTSNGAYPLQVNGQIFATNATIATSDGRYKANVAEVTGALADVCALRPVAFDWKAHQVHNFQAGRSVGFIAQEVQQALAARDFVGAVVKGNECELPDGTTEEFLGLSDGALIPLLVAAIKELKAQNDALSARVAALESA